MGVNELPSIVTGTLTSGSLTFIDFYYVNNNVIDEVYAFDGVVQGVFFTMWVLVFARWGRDYF
jgi:hypothetical protein